MSTNSFKLDDSFVESYANRQPPWGPLGEVTYMRTYSRDGERWHETVRRVVEGCYSWQERHCLDWARPWDSDKAQHSAQQMYDLIWNMKFLPPGRGLWSMGTELLHTTGAAANNCGFVTIDTAADFGWLMLMLMCGVGVGFRSGKLLVGDRVGGPNRSVHRTMSVPDNREGWALSVKLLIMSYLRGAPELQFDYSRIRPAGSPIKGFGGTASGPEPLKELHASIRKLLDGYTGRFLSEAAIVDIGNMIGRCVVAGNIRRSAEIALGSNSSNFINLKNREMYPYEVDSWRWASNNSVIAGVSDDLSRVANSIRNNGEPGVFWLGNARAYGRMGRRPNHVDRDADGCNPCAEQTLESKELCCLVETFPSRHDSYYEYQRTLKYAYLYAKTVTLIPTHSYETNRIIAKNRRIGCSMSGIQRAIAKFGRTEFFGWADRGYKYLRALDERYSEWYGVNRSNKITSVKPSGTVSLLPGVPPGIHWPHSEYYYRVIRFASDSAHLRQLRDAGYRCVDLAPNEPNTTAVYFAVKEENFDRSEGDVSMWEQLELAAKMQHYWADNQVSITVKFNPDSEGRDIEHALELYADRLKAVSFLPKKSHGYAHAPYQAIDKAEYERYVLSLRPVELSSAHEVTEQFCDGDKCTL